MATREKSGTRLIQLDILRGMAILLVLGCHYALYVPHGELRALASLNAVLKRFGWAGVDLFFVLSGFLVGGLLFKEIRTRRSLDVSRFLIRRAFKIWPLYYAYILVMFLRHTWTHHSVTAALHTWWPNLLHVQNYFLWAPRAHTWSLAVEEHFYLALPIVLWLATSGHWRREVASGEKSTDSANVKPATEGAALQSIPALPIIAYSVIALCTVMRCIGVARNVPFKEDAVWWMFAATHLRADSLFFGVLLAYWYHFEPQRLAFAERHAGMLLMLGLLLIAPVACLKREVGWFVATIGYSLLYLGFGAMLLALIYTVPGATHGCRPLARFLDSWCARLLAAIGVYSYPIYLWHHDIANLPVKALAERGILQGLPPDIRWVVFAALHLALAIAGGVIWSLLLEKPSLALRDRLFPRRADALPSADALHEELQEAKEKEALVPAVAQTPLSV